MDEMPTYCGDVIDIGLLHHCGHGLLDRAVAKLIVGVFIPDLLEIKEWPAQVPFQEPKAPRVGHTGRRGLEVGVAGDDKPRGGHVGVHMGGLPF